MKRIFLVGAVLTATAFGQQTGEQANLGIFAETKLMRIAGMKPVIMPKLPFGMKMPAAARNTFSGTPTRALTVKLWSPTAAPDDATASLAIPAGLQLGDKLDLDIYRPMPVTAPSGGSTAPTDQSVPQQTQDFTIKIYWGSSATVQDGQPKVISLANLTAEARSVFTNRMAIAQRSAATMIYKPTGSTAFWPSKTSKAEIKPEATLPGTYALFSYAGSASFDAPDGVDFLAPIEITSPNLDKQVPLDGPLAFQWNAIPNCLGQFAAAFGIQDKNTMILWASSEAYGERMAGDMSYLGMDDVKNLVNQHVLLSGDATSVTVPSGIFKDCSIAMYNMTGYGPGAASANTQPLARLQTKTDLMVMLTGVQKGGRPSRGGDQK